MGANDLPAQGLELNVSRWGNSLAVRLPVALARQLGVGEGDVLQVQAGDDGGLQLRARRCHTCTGYLQVGVACQRRFHITVQLGIAQCLPPLRGDGGG